MGRLRSSRSSPHREPALSAGPALLPRHLARVDGPRASRRSRPETRKLPRHIRSPLLSRAHGLLGGGAHGRLRHGPVGIRLTSQRPQGHERLLGRSLHERHHALHSRHRRRDPERRLGPGHHRGRGGCGLRLSRPRHRLSARALPGLLTARGEHLAARRACGLAAQCGRAPAPPRGRHGGAGPAAP